MTAASVFLTCVMHLTTNSLGVVVTRDIYDKHTGEVWVVMETIKGEETAGIEELKIIPCSEVPLDQLKNRDYVLKLLNGVK